MKYSSLALACVLSVSQAVQAFDTCRALFAPQMTERFALRGPEVELHNLARTQGENARLTLGSGDGGGVAYLRFAPGRSDRIIVEKVYQDTPYGLNRVQADAFLMRELQDLISAARARTIDTFIINRSEAYVAPAEGKGQILRNYLLSGFVRGRTVHDLLIDSSISPELKTELRAIYNRKLKALTSLLSNSNEIKHGPRTEKADTRLFQDRKLDGLPIVTGEVERFGIAQEFIIKTDNVIVDPNDLNQMTIIDPY